MSTSSVTAVRREALHQLERIERDDAYVGLVDASALDDELDARGRRQVTEYVAGVTRWRRWLDFLLAAFYHGDLAAMEQRLRVILRLGTYDLLFLQTPPHAAVHEAVELAKATVRKGAGGLVNGILRTIDRQRDDLPMPDTGDHAEDLALRHSHPTWLVRRWLARFGVGDTEALLRWNNTRPAYGLRVNLQHVSVAALCQALDAAGVDWTLSPYLDDFVRVEQLQPIVQGGWLDEGRCAVQDESAGLIVRLLDPQPGETILDTCAAPGGKAIYAALRMQGRGTVIAADVNARRLQRVKPAADAQGAGALVQTQAADLRAWTHGPQADRVLLDAPCSGLGVLAKRADLRWQRTPDDLRELTALQDELLDAAARHVRPGGWLVYSTCTIAPEENEDRVAAFLGRHPDFHVESAGACIPEALVTEEGFFATLPHRDRVDGAFGARLRRVD